MGLIRLIILLAAALAGYLLWNKITRKKKSSRALPDSKHMVRCDGCHLYLPQHQAIRHDGRWYCSNEHIARKQDGNHDD